MTKPEIPQALANDHPEISEERCKKIGDEITVNVALIVAHLGIDLKFKQNYLETTLRDMKRVLEKSPPTTSSQATP